MATQPETQVVPLQGATPFVGGEVFNPANFVRITNLDEASVIGRGAKAKKAIQGRYNGKDYLFPFGEPVNVHLDVARHCFGLGLDDKSTALSRLGWVQSSADFPDAIERLSNIRFEDLPELMEASRFKAPEIAHASGLVKGDEAAGGVSAPPDAAKKKA
jgi:hypothetical protein